MKQNIKRVCAGILAALMVFSMMPLGQAEAAKRPKFSAKKITVEVGKTKKLSVKYAKGAKFTWKVKSKKIAKIKKSSKYSYRIKGVKKGSTKVTCKVKRKRKKTITLSCTVKVTQKKKLPPVTPIKATYQPILGQMGNCVSLSQLKDTKMLAHIKKHYTSITLENEMKPEGILKNAATLVTVEEAKAKGYVIPDSYTEGKVPVLNLGTIDEVLKIAQTNGLKMRAHTLVWHSQTPEWFFREGYSANGKYVSEAVMDARMEMYIRSMINHVYTLDGGIYKDTVYAWDVANEYFHNNAGKNWSGVYGNREGKLGSKPGYIKKAFEIASDELTKLGIRDKVTLVYNDYNTYEVADKIITLIDFINENGKFCDGVGMQSHLDIDYPSPELYGATIAKFAAKNYEIQITEFDATINNQYGNYRQESQTNAQQGAYVGKIMKEIVAQRKAGANITGFTIWGLCDAVSWRGDRQFFGRSSNPTLFETSVNDPKPSYYSFMGAAKGW